MLTVVAVVLVGWVLLTALGLAMLAMLPTGPRDRLLAAAPLVGVVHLVVVLHWTGLFVGVGTGLWLAVALALGSLAVAWRRGARPRGLTRRHLLTLLAPLLIGVVPGTLAVLPSFFAGDSRVVQPGPNNDAFYYVSVSGWLTDHSILDVPDVGAAPGTGDATPSDGAAVGALVLNLRLGQELVLAALTTATRTDAVTTFSPWVGLWVLLVPGGCVAAASLLRWRPLSGYALGGLSGVSAVLHQQVYNQNAASVLGIALAPLVLASVVAALRDPRRLPVPVAAAMLAGLVGTYGELGAYLGPALALFTLLTGRSELRRRIGRAVGVVGIALVLAPLAFYRALRFSTGPPSAFDAFPSPFLQATREEVVDRVLGLAPVSSGGQAGDTATVLLAVGLLGVAAALALSRERAAWLGLLLGGAALVGSLSAAERGYTQRRAVEILLPLVLMVVVAGWSAVIELLVPRQAAAPAGRTADPGPDTGTDPGSGSGTGLRAGAARRLVAAVTCLGLAAAGAVTVDANVRSTVAAARADYSPTRHVTPEFAEAAGWVRDTAGAASGSDVTVSAPDFFDQLWIADALSDLDEVSYVSLHTSYLRVSRYWAGEVDRFQLVGRGAFVDAAAGVVVRENGRFRLLDLSRGEAVVAVPSQLEAWYPYAGPAGDMSAFSGGDVTILGSAGATDRVSLRLRSTADGHTISVRLKAAGSRGAGQVVEGVSAPAWVGLDPPVDPGDLVRVLDIVDPGLQADAVLGSQPPFVFVEGVRRD